MSDLFHGNLTFDTVYVQESLTKWGSRIIRRIPGTELEGAERSRKQLKRTNIRERIH